MYTHTHTHTHMETHTHTHSHVSVGGWDPPGLDPLHRAVPPHGHADVGVAVRAVTLDLGGPPRAAGPARREPPHHQGHLWGETENRTIRTTIRDTSGERRRTEPLEPLEPPSGTPLGRDREQNH